MFSLISRKFYWIKSLNILFHRFFFPRDSSDVYIKPSLLDFLSATFSLTLFISSFISFSVSWKLSCLSSVFLNFYLNLFSLVHLIIYYLLWNVTSFPSILKLINSGCTYSLFSFLSFLWHIFEKENGKIFKVYIMIWYSYTLWKGFYHLVIHNLTYLLFFSTLYQIFIIQ